MSMGQRADFIDFSKIVPPKKPNWFLALPPGSEGAVKGKGESPLFPVEVRRLKKSLEKLIGDEPRVTILKRSEDGGRYELIARTAILRFPNKVSIEIIELGEQSSSVAIFSRSVYGYSDFGANRKRVNDWLRRLERMVTEGE